MQELTLDDPGGPPTPPRSALEGGRTPGLKEDDGLDMNAVAIARPRSELAEWGGHMTVKGVLIRTKGIRPRRERLWN